MEPPTTMPPSEPELLGWMGDALVYTTGTDVLIDQRDGTGPHALGVDPARWMKFNGGHLQAAPDDEGN